MEIRTECQTSSGRLLNSNKLLLVIYATEWLKSLFGIYSCLFSNSSLNNCLIYDPAACDIKNEQFIFLLTAAFHLRKRNACCLFTFLTQKRERVGKISTFEIRLQWLADRKKQPNKYDKTNPYFIYINLQEKRLWLLLLLLLRYFLVSLLIRKDSMFKIVK